MSHQARKEKFKDVVREDMQAIDVTEEDAEDNSRRKPMIHCGNPSWEQPEEAEEEDVKSDALICIMG